MKKAELKQGFIGGLLILILILAVLYGAYSYYQYSGLNSGNASSTAETDHTPVILNLNPNQAGVGETVVITGQGFVSSDNTVTFGSYTLGVFASSDGKSISFQVPASLNSCQSSFCKTFVYNIEPGLFPISVKNKNGTSNVVNLNVGGGNAPAGAPTYP